MKILHMMLSCFYIDDYNYQENALPRQNKIDGHEVRIIASTVAFLDNAKAGFLKPSTYLNKDLITVIRLPFRKFIPLRISSKIRTYPNVYKLIDEFKPNVIIFHGIAALELLTVAKYKKNNMDVKLYVDNHADFHNSAQNLLSRELLHKGFYKRIVKKSIPYIDKIFYISKECCDLLKELYSVPNEKMEFYPLGGDIIDKENHDKNREYIRKELSISDDEILFIHSGKLDKLKRTIDILEAFYQVKNKKFRLIILGSIPEGMKNKIIPLIERDNRVSFLGWKTSEELLRFLCAGDMYLQPGDQSSTMQNAICCGCPVMLYPYDSHEPYLRGNGFFVENLNDIINCFKKIEENPKILERMKINSIKVAHELLDYKKLADRLYR